MKKKIVKPEISGTKNKKILNTRVSNQVLTIGGATQDIFLSISNLSSKELEIDNIKKKYLLIPEANKLDVSSLYYSTGGGATNTGVAFARLGFSVESFFKIGKDTAGDLILADLKKSNVKVNNISRSENLKSGTSFILPSESGERTVLVYRGASESLSESDLPDNIFANKNLVFIGPLSGNSVSILSKSISLAKSNQAVIALNPSKFQINYNISQLQENIKQVDILLLNNYEAKLLTQKLFEQEFNEKDAIKKLLLSGPQIIVVTAGQNGAYVGYNNVIYYHKIVPSKVVNTVGAGDAFSSCFVANIIKTGFSHSSIKIALISALINSASVVAHHDAKEGLLTSSEIETKLKHIDIETFDITKI